MKIKIKTQIIDLASCFTISMEADEIHFEHSAEGGDWERFRRGVELTSAEFDTLSTWLNNQANNPHTVVI